MKHPSTVVLKTIGMFRDLSENSLVKVSKSCDVRFYRPNMLVISQNATANKVGFIVSGFVKLMRGDRQSPSTGAKDDDSCDKRMLVDLLGPGDSIGAASALLGEEYSSSAIALTPCSIAFVSSDFFISLLYEIDGLSEQVMNTLAKNVIASEKHAQLMNGDLKTRVFAIRKRCEQLGIDIDRWLSNAEVARMAGATRVSVSQIMNREKQMFREMN